ncbi:helix-turn-helix domain-containing protein [Microbulbifer taiwanensis]|uniref:Helix-turn-helix domain-containing protein n=2 Tax=Microbulbifer taiwanensis TaxID=986746 RepID=A0ABW1YMW1_9GAMM
MERIPVLEPFGEHIRELRVRLDLTQEDLGGLCELDRTYISGIETGKRNCSLLNLFKLAEALQVEPKDLLNYDDAGKPKSTEK